MRFPALEHTQPQWYELSADASDDASLGAEPDGHGDELARRLRGPGRIDGAGVPKWRWLSTTREPFDLVFTMDSVRLVSPRVRDVLDAHLGPKDEVQWLPGTLKHGEGKELTYWTPHFPVHHDVLDEELTERSPRHGTPGRYFYSPAKLAGHGMTTWHTPAREIVGYGRVVHMPSRIAVLTVVVSAAIARDLRAAGVTGARLSPAPVS
ncbi:hypothetical protein [Cellulomonas sp. PS-H5]|uniref:hypothetical protein n=1 Tax=Cellulomonas sp. PS-H5 TaxID=2820400 RepID=UPI001C4EF18A|nr:hypothetical protein [Cellulomonas sp. PS-H5]MBW0254045.1 hypothetical protein [Cellulomonas sp. PS-H5]